MDKRNQNKIHVIKKLFATGRDNQAIFKLVPLFVRALKSHEKRLPQEILNNYLNSLLQKKDIFLKSAYQFGTPQYFFDEPSLSLQISHFHKVFSRYLDRYRIFYALKSNSFEGICKSAVAAGIGLDVSSGFELKAALSMGCKHIIFSGPGKTDDELLLAIQNRQNVTLLMDSMGEFERLSKILKQEEGHGDTMKVGIRVHSNHDNGWNKFGIPLGNLPVILKRAMIAKDVEIHAIQFHASWNLGPKAQVNMIEQIGSYIRQYIPMNLMQSFQVLDIGGGFWPEQGEWLNPQNTLKGKLIQLTDPEFGFKIRHYYHKAKPLEDFAREIAKALSRQGPPLCDVEIWLEPGRWISTPAMHILLRVVDKKDFRTVITDGGTNLLGWERPLSEFIPVINLTKPSLKERHLKIFGSLCTPYDIWGISIFGEEVESGDILLIPDQGAYTYSLRQCFIKPIAKVVAFDGENLVETEKENSFSLPPSILSKMEKQALLEKKGYGTHNEYS